ncbi:MAG: hydroxyethylthiazole kinase [Clostridia bacterium]|nr:hydroxyethylthiazole kinase [Clostridia bacterium]
MFGKYLENVRKMSPIVHSITNYVTVNDVANALLAIGAKPIMADDARDAAEITKICSALNINIGTLNEMTVKAMFAAGKEAKKLGHPVILDPVGAGAGSFRTETALGIIRELSPDAIKGNISEISTLAGALGAGADEADAQAGGKTKGVDADMSELINDENLLRNIRLAKSLAKVTGSVIIITGAIDLIADENKCYAVRNGHPDMADVTGTGCRLSAMTGAYIAANPQEKTEAAAAAVITSGLSGELAAERLGKRCGNAAFRDAMTDSLYLMDAQTLEKGEKYEIY